MTDRFYEARLEPCSGLTSSSFPYQKKSDRLQLHSSYKTGVRVAALWLFKRKQTKTNENISIAIVLRQIPGLHKSGEFCGLLNGAMLT